MRSTIPLAAALALMAANAACAAPTDDTASSAGKTTAAQSTAQPHVVVHKNPYCSCCNLWVAHMQEAGFAVDVVPAEDLESFRKQAGVPAGKGSCHTALVDGYFIEGHVPAEDVKRLLRERPAARGLTAPGMPVGSPGMEVASGATPAYSVLLVAEDGSTSEFARHGGD